MTFRQMELFIAVCENKSISKTSGHYFVSQQSVSKMMRDLEDELDCTLLTRTKMGVNPTECGLYFLNECRTMVEKKNAIFSHIAQLHQKPEEVIYLGMAFGVISALPHRLIRDFQEAYSHIRVEYSDHTDAYLEALLLNGDYDFCITAGILDNDRFSSELLFARTMYLCIPCNHAFYNKETITLADLENQKFASLSTNFHIRRDFEIACNNIGFSPVIKVTLNDFNSVKEVAQINNLLYLSPANTIGVNNESVRYYKFPDENVKRKLYFTKNKNKQLSENMTKFYNFLKLYIAKDEANDTNNLDNPRFT